MSNAQNLIKNSLANAGAGIFVQILGFVLLPYIIRLVGNEDYGLFVLVMSFSGYFGFMNFGMPMGIVKFVSGYNGKKDFESINKVFNIGFFFNLIVGLIIGSGIAVLAVFFLDIFHISPEHLDTARKMALIAAGFAVVSSPFSVLYNVLWGLEKQQVLAVQSVVVMLLKYALYIGVILLNGTVLGLVYATIMASVFGWLINYSALKKTLPRLSLSVKNLDRILIKEIFSFNVWSFISNIAQTLIYQVDKLVIGLFLPVASITYYDIAQKIHALVRQIHGYVHGLTLVDSSRAYGEENYEYIKKLIYSGVKLNIIIVLPVVFITMIFAEPFIKIWLGSEYLITVPYIRLFVSYFFVVVITTVPTNILIGKGDIKFFSVIAVINGLINLILSVILVQWFDVMGVIIGTVIPYLITFPISLYYIVKRVDFSLKFMLTKSVLKPYIVNILFFLPVYLIIEFGLSEYLISFIRLITVGFMIYLIISGLEYLLILEKSEKEILRKSIMNYVPLKKSGSV